MNIKPIISSTILATTLPIAAFTADYPYNPGCLNTPPSAISTCSSFSGGGILPNNHYDPDTHYNPYTTATVPNNYYNGNSYYLSNNHYNPRSGAMGNTNINIEGLIGTPIRSR
ncbi:hypothetical protein TAO_0845 [Candidatus Nitrosoglobus terrae]|uniref:Uncharacterized protein n=1 Tax=Candidatus Nitrosoglobus terrae TaxID=1630141 RepID=A0A1Q2SM46_9GAMM|nr:hypothetical protein [Candidatus Nitrosoglobus terrae]BAW80215.1 hypothetical protein TAO_0845 [Candidatus Nitrosoglobus terrae]